MKKHLKKIAATMLVFLMFANVLITAVSETGIGRLHVTAHASELVASGTCGDDLTWELDNEGTLTISGTGPMTDWTSSRESPWYSRRSSIKRIVLDDRISSIGNRAFMDCDSLTSVIIGDNVTNIGYNAFFDCDSLERVIIGDSTTIIGDNAFYHCDSLTSVIIGSSVTTIGNSEFAYCRALSSINIPDSVTSIGEYAFRECNSLSSVAIGNSVTAIGDAAFMNCSSLTSVTIPDSVILLGDSVFLDCSSLKTAIIGDKVTSIGLRAFAFCGSLTSVIVGESVSSIGYEAFRGCGLKNIVIPNSVVSLGDGAFWQCKSLKTAIIGDSVDSISAYAFYSCSSLTNITIPNTVTSIGDKAFGLCRAISYVYYSGDKGEWESISVEGGNGLLTNATIYYNSKCSDFSSILDWNVNNIPEGCYKITVVDDFNFPVANAFVALGNSSGTTSEDGSILLELPDYNDYTYHTYVLEISHDDYGTYTDSQYKAKSTNYDTIVLGGDLQSVKLTCNSVNTELLSTEKTIDVNKKDTPITIKVTPKEGVSIRDYCIKAFIDDSRDIASSENGEFSLKYNDFQKGETVFLYYKVNGEDNYKRRKLQLNIIDSSLEGDLFFEIGSDDSVSFGDAAGGFLSSLNLKLNRSQHLVKFKVTGDTIRVGMNMLSTKGDDYFTQDFSSWGAEEEQKARKAWNKYVSSINSVNNGLSTKKVLSDAWDKKKMNASIAIYAEGKYTKNGISGVSGKLIVVLSATMGTEAQISITPPIVAGFDITGTISNDGTLSLKTLEPANWEAAVLFSGSLNVEGHAGIGIADILSVGVYGKATIGAEYEFKVNASDYLSEWKKVYLSGDLGLYAKALWMSMDFPLIKGTWDIYNRDTSLSVASYSLTRTNSSSTDNLYTEDLYSSMSRDYLNYTSEWLSNTDGQNSSDVIASNLKLSMYESPQPQLIKCGDTIMMLYIDDAAERADNDRSILMYSLYNASTNSWSEPIAVSDDSTADFSPVVYSNDTDIWVAWQNAPALIPEDSELSETAKTFELFTGYYNIQNGAWITSKATSNDEYEMLYDFVENTEGLYLAWVSNAEDDIFGQNSSNEIKYSVYVNDSWVEPVTISTGLNPIVSMDAGNIGDTYVAVILDGDTDLTTIDDRSISLYALDGMDYQLSDRELKDSNIHFSEFQGSEMLTWVSDGNIYYISEPLQTPNSLLPAEYALLRNNAQLITDEENSCILFSNYQDNSSAVYVSWYDNNGEWSAPLRTALQNGHIDSLSSVLIDGNLVSVYPRTTATISEETGETVFACNLSFLKVSCYSDLSISCSNLDYNVITGRDASDIEFAVTNNGNSAVDSFKIDITNTSGEIITSQNFSQIIKSGETCSVSVNIPHHQTVLEGDLTATVTIENDVDTSDNAINFSLAYSEIESFVETLVQNDVNVVYVKVINNGILPTDGLLTLKKGNGSIFFEIPFQTLNQGEFITFNFEINDDSYFADILDYDVMTVSATANKTDLLAENNTQHTVIYDNRYVTDVDINENSILLVSEQSYKVPYAVYPENATQQSVTWSSSDDSVATVDDLGVITAKSIGTVEITVATQDGQLTDCCEITVLDIVSTDEVEVDTTVGVAPILPDEVTAHLSDGSEKQVPVVWDNIPQSNYMNEGTFTVNGKVDFCEQQVKCSVNVFSVPVSSVTLDQTDIVLNINDSILLSATVLPDNATDKTVVWQTSSADVVSVEDGVVTTVGCGVATITATVGNASDSCVVTVAHTYTSIDTAPDCTNNGYTTYICLICGDSYTADETTAIGHDYESAVTKAATCTEDGMITYTCKNDSSHTYTEAIEAIGHTVIVDEAVEPTETDTGLTEGSHCSVCGEIIVAQEIIPALGLPDNIDYDVTPNINGGASKLYEPWGLRYFAAFNGDDIDKIADRGIAILKDAYYTDGMTAEEFCSNKNAHVYLDSKGELGFEATSTNNPNGRYYATLTEGIYSYDISAYYYVVPFAVMENGQTIYGTIKKNSMEKILNTNLNLSSITSEEKAICTCILDLKESVAAHYAASGVPGASIDMEIPRGASQTAAASTTTTTQSGITPNIVAGASRLIEPWGLRYFATYTSSSNIADRGVVILCEKYYDSSYSTSQDKMRLNANSYVFTENNGTLLYDEGSGRYYATVTEGVSSKDIADVYYVVPYVVLENGSYVYGTVKSNSMMKIMNTNLNIASVSETEKEVSRDIIALYEAVQAYYAD